MAEWLPEATCDGIVLDLGVSSPQLDQAERGFSFQSEGPLDMRMDPTQPLSAEVVVNETPVDELERILRELGEEPRARRLARMIDEERKVRRLKTTRELATLIERGAPRRGARLHPATRTFQAIRLVVNDELGQLRRGLEAASKILRPGGRLAVITFHSIEVRILKEFGRERTRDYTFDGNVDVPELRRPQVQDMRWIHRRAVTASPEELASNPRARSAQLRALEKVSHGA
jgi:16S rRNA (cytosine1402-N4)-methyltransferase